MDSSSKHKTKYSQIVESTYVLCWSKDQIKCQYCRVVICRFTKHLLLKNVLFLRTFINFSENNAETHLLHKSKNHFRFLDEFVSKQIKWRQNKSDRQTCLSRQKVSFFPATSLLFFFFFHPSVSNKPDCIAPPPISPQPTKNKIGALLGIAIVFYSPCTIIIESQVYVYNDRPKRNISLAFRGQI